MIKKIYMFILFCSIFLYCKSIGLCADSGIQTSQAGTPVEDYGKLIEKVFEQSPVYKNKLSEFAKEELSRTVYKFRWIPHPLIDSGYAGNFYAAENSRHENVIKNALILHQALPAGLSLQVSAEQFFGIKRKKHNPKLRKPDYEYDFGSSLALSIPLYVLCPSLLPSAVKSELQTYMLLSETAELDLRSARKKIRNEAVSRISSYLLLQERIGIEEQREILRQKEAASDNVLWETGGISSFELSERTTKRYEQYLALLQLKENFCILRQDFYDIGLTEEDMPVSIDSWLAYWEDFILKNRTENGLETAAEEKRLTVQFYNQAEQGLLSLPKINLYAQAAPAAGTGNPSALFVSSIRDYWKKSQKWDWSFNASVKISLFPFEREYLTAKEFSLARQQYNNDLRSLNVYRKNREERYQNRIEFLQKLSDKAEREKNDAFNKTITAASLNRQGYLSETSFAYQKLNTLLAENNYKEVRLRRISAVLEGY